MIIFYVILNKYKGFCKKKNDIVGVIHLYFMIITGFYY
jgi:hypothetical protein